MASIRLSSFPLTLHDHDGEITVIGGIFLTFFSLLPDGASLPSPVA